MPPKTPAVVGVYVLVRRDSLNAGYLVGNPVRHVIYHEVRTIGEKIVKPAVHIFQLPVLA